MSKALYDLGGLRFWDELEINVRDFLVKGIASGLDYGFRDLNNAWRFFRFEGPCLTPREYINPEYSEDEIFVTSDVKKTPAALRAETTASSYRYAEYLINEGVAKAPFCVWQAGKSFRRENNDGASAAKLRFNEFYQLEFQLIFKEDTKADIFESAIKFSTGALKALLGGGYFLIKESDRLPSYSLRTTDIEMWHNDESREVASISERTDFKLSGYKVVEIAIGLDRLVHIYFDSKGFCDE